MKNINIKYSMILFFAATFILGCKKQLNVLPTNSEVDGTIISDTKSATIVLNGVYYAFANSQYGRFGESTYWTLTNEIYPSELAGLLTNVSGTDGFNAHTLSPLSLSIDDFWNYGYKLVNSANGFLKNVAPVQNIPAATKKQMIAEAKFLRAFGHEYLLLYFGQYYDPSSKYGIILRNEIVTAEKINLPRSPVADVYTSILSDLDDAIAGLPEKNTVIYYANVTAAKILKARVLINRGSPGDYQQVIDLTNAVIGSGTFDLEANTKDLFLTKGFISKEVVLGVKPFPYQDIKFTFNTQYGQFPVADNFVNLLKNDPRNQWVYKSAYNDKRDITYNQNTKFYGGDISGYDPIPTPNVENCYAFRLTEAYLLEAEALTLVPGGDLTKSKTLLKTVMGHAGFTDFTQVDNTTDPAALRILVLKETIKNFFAENGVDYFALRRLPMDEIKLIQPNITSKNLFILPIPQTEVSANNLVIPNP